MRTLPPATSPAAVRGWTAGLEGLPEPHPTVLRVLAGDLDATWTTRPSGPSCAAATPTRLGRSGARCGGPGPLRLRLPRLAVDHVLGDPRIAVGSVELVTVRGSDHRAVVAKVVLPG